MDVIQKMIFQLQRQLGNADKLKGILKQLKLNVELPDGQTINPTLVYLPIKNSLSYHTQFFEEIKQGILTNFVFSCREIERKLNRGNPQTEEELFEKALRKLSRHTAKGELGELILFTLLDVYFGAPKLLSKIADKQNPRMPAFGADAVHGQFYEGEFRLFLGESKLHAWFTPAASKALESIENAKINYETEFDLLDSNMDFPNMDEEMEIQLLNLLNPFEDTNLDEIIHSPCFIGFNAPKIIANSNDENEFLNSYSDLAKTCVVNFYKKAKKKNIDFNAISLLILPYSCVDKLVSEFIEYMGIQE